MCSSLKIPLKRKNNDTDTNSKLICQPKQKTKTSSALKKINRLLKSLPPPADLPFCRRKKLPSSTMTSHQKVLLLASAWVNESFLNGCSVFISFPQLRVVRMTAQALEKWTKCFPHTPPPQLSSSPTHDVPFRNLYGHLTFWYYTIKEQLDQQNNPPKVKMTFN